MQSRWLLRVRYKKPSPLQGQFRWRSGSYKSGKKIAPVNAHYFCCQIPTSSMRMRLLFAWSGPAVGGPACYCAFQCLWAPQQWSELFIFWEFAKNFDHVENQVDWIPFDVILKCIEFHIIRSNGLQSYVGLSFFNKIKAFWNYSKWYPINLIFYVVDVLSKFKKVNSTDHYYGHEKCPQTDQNGPDQTRWRGTRWEPSPSRGALAL